MKNPAWTKFAIAVAGIIVGAIGMQVVHVAWRWYLRHETVAFLQRPMESGRHAAFIERSRAGGVDLLFLGDSMIDWFKDTQAWKQFDGPRTANYGMFAESCGGMLWRVQQGEIDGLSPHVVVIQIGTNDLQGRDNESIVADMQGVVAEVHIKCPSAKIILIGILPRNDGGDEILSRIRSINQQLATTEGAVFLDVGTALTDSSGHLAKECSADDGVHLTPEGYRRWANLMGPQISRLMAISKGP